MTRGSRPGLSGALGSNPHRPTCGHFLALTDMCVFRGQWPGKGREIETPVLRMSSVVEEAGRGDSTASDSYLRTYFKGHPVEEGTDFSVGLLRPDVQRKAARGCKWQKGWREGGTSGPRELSSDACQSSFFPSWEVFSRPGVGTK